jgi:hypothetical protein
MEQGAQNPILKSNPLTTRQTWSLFLLYPIAALVFAVVLLGFLSVVIRTFQLNLEKFLYSMAASFLIVSLLSLIGDQEILNYVGRFVGVNPNNPYAKGAIKYGKSINLGLTAILQLIATIMMLVGYA